MPRKTDAIPLNDVFLDRRIKLLPCQKEMVVAMHSRGASINGIARMYKVNKRLIQFIIYPERQRRNVELRHERGGTMQYYNKADHAKAIKEHRQYKKEALKLIVNQ